MRLAQNFGVANATTKGACRSSAWSTETCRSAVSGGRAVVIFSAGESATVGFFEGKASAPTAGAADLSRTTTLPMPWIFAPPTGSASRKYVPGSETRRLAT